MLRLASVQPLVWLQQYAVPCINTALCNSVQLVSSFVARHIAFAKSLDYWLVLQWDTVCACPNLPLSYPAVCITGATQEQRRACSARRCDWAVATGLLQGPDTG